MRINKTDKKIDTIKKLGIYSWSIIGFLILSALFFYFLFRIRIAILPLIIAMGIAYFLSPLVEWLSKKMKRVFAIIISYIVFTGFIFAFFFFTIPLVIEQFRVFIFQLPVYIINLTEYINEFIENSLIVGTIETTIGKEFLPLDSNAITNYVLNTFGLGGTNFLQNITNFTKSTINIIITFIIGPLLSIYILKDAGRLRNVFLKVLPVKAKYQASIIMDRINDVGGRYIRGQILVSIIVGILCTVVLLLLRVEFAILLGFIAGITNLIPFLGPVIGAIPAALAALFISPLKAILVVLLFVAVQQIDNYVISPNIMKHQVGVHPSIVILVLISGGALFGLIGLLIAVPVAGVVQAILKYYLLDRKSRRSL